MAETLSFLLFFALINVAIHILCNKWGLLTWYQLNRLRFMPKDCNFCFFFWLAFIELLIMESASAKHSVEGWLSCFVYALVTAVLSLKFKP